MWVKVAIVLACAALLVEALPSVHINKNGLFETEDGHVMIFHGASYINKKDDMIHVSDEELQMISKDMGFSIVRLGFLWNLLEIQPGVYNWTYLDEMEKTVNRFREHGIYSFLDMHQDIWSPLYCGQGIPNFYSYPANFSSYQRGGYLTFPHPIASPKYENDTQDEFPQIVNCDEARGSPLGFSGVYGSFALSSAAQRLYTNDGGLLEKFGDMWELVVRRFYNNSGVLGYELLNEPWVGDVWTKPWLLSAAQSDKTNMKQMNEYLHKRIRKYDDTKIIFFEPATGGNLGMSIGYTQGPGGKDYNDRQVLSHHIYCPKAVHEPKLDKPWEKFLASILFDVGCRISYDWLANKRLKEIEKLGCGGLLTEFAGLDYTEVGEWDAVNKLQGILDQHFHGWVYWEHSNYPTGLTSFAKQIEPDQFIHILDPRVVAHLTRTYARSTAGDPVSMSFNPSTAEFNFQYKPRPLQASNVTEVYYNAPANYPFDATCEIQPANSAECTTNFDQRLITIEHNHNAIGLTLSVTIKPNLIPKKGSIRML